jgi:hypothetical protein
MPILTRERRLVVLMAGQPDDNDWCSLNDEGSAALEQARRECKIPPKKVLHRRGRFHALRCGVSHGGGQKLPGNLKNNVTNTRIVKHLNSLRPFQRFAGYSTGKATTKLGTSLTKPLAQASSQPGCLGFTATMSTI